MRILPAFVVFMLAVAPVSTGLAESGAQPESSLPPGLQGIQLNGLFYLSYTGGELEGRTYSEFFIHRAYITVRKELLPFLDARITFDTNQDGEGDGEGDMEVRLKYAHAIVDLGNWQAFHNIRMEFGIVHMVWLDYQEHINLYRMRDPMFMERVGIYNSADFGATLFTDFGPSLPEEVRQRVGRKYAGRYGSFAIGLYNGTGYHGVERNENKVFESRLSLRPLPAQLPGLQLSGLIILGKGNKEGTEATLPDWDTYAGFISYQDRWGTLTAQYVAGEGNQKGNWNDGLVEDSYSGYSFFAEVRPWGAWRVIGGYDVFNRETTTTNWDHTSWYTGLGYDFGNRNLLIVDYKNLDYDLETHPDDYWTQLTFQIHF